MLTDVIENGCLPRGRGGGQYMMLRIRRRSRSHLMADGVEQRLRHAPPQPTRLLLTCC